jgi:hypothetical protein
MRKQSCWSRSAAVPAGSAWTSSASTSGNTTTRATKPNTSVLCTVSITPCCLTTPASTPGGWESTASR